MEKKLVELGQGCRYMRKGWSLLYMPDDPWRSRDEVVRMMGTMESEEHRHATLRLIFYGKQPSNRKISRV